MQPENEPLLLPSNFPETCHIQLGLVSAVKTEYEIHEGQAHDCLEDIRKCIQMYNHHIAIKTNEVHGQCYAT